MLDGLEHWAGAAGGASHVAPIASMFEFFVLLQSSLAASALHH